jgi:hypothetical protein
LDHERAGHRRDRYADTQDAGDNAPLGGRDLVRQCPPSSAGSGLNQSVLISSADRTLRRWVART